MTSNEFKLLREVAGGLESPVLDVGSRHESTDIANPRSLFDASVRYVGLDMEPGDGVDLIHDMETPLRETFKTIICCSMLEHCKRPWVAAKNIEDALESGGSLFVSAPFVWRYHDYPSDYWRFSTEAYKILFPNIEWKFLRYTHKLRHGSYRHYIDLSNKLKSKRPDENAAIAMSIGFGRKI